MSISVLGSANMDLVARVDRLPRPGETIAGRSFSMEPGGKGANQALAARRAGGEIRFIGAVGQDPFADTTLDELAAAGVDLQDVRRVAGATGIAQVTIDDTGENTIAVIPGGNGAVDQTDAERCIGAMQQGDILMLQLEIPLDVVERALILARPKGIRTMLNIAPARSAMFGFGGMADIIVANESEFAHLIGRGISSPAERVTALRQLHDETRQTIVVTFGAEGALAISGGEIFAQRGLDIAPVDTVGAGDTFCGYLAQGIARGSSIDAALKEAVVAGSLACLRSGAQRAIPSREEVLSYLA